jgi:hypothetical protein
VNITDVYIGSTTDFTRRKYGHKSDCNNEKLKRYNYNVYQFIRNNGGWINWKMVEIEKYPCNNGNESCARERYWVEQLHATLNSNVPNRSKEEYYEQNKEQKREYYQQYNEQNKEQIRKQKKEYYQQNAEKIKEHAKQYRQQNAEKILEKL